MKRLAFLLLLSLCAPASAQDLPAQFSVTGVAADDVLNIRAAPDAGAEKIGALGPYEIDIEVLALSETGRWGRIGLPEGNGWVNMRYLERQPLPEGAAIPRPLTCLGTEPFWRIGLYPGGDEYERMGEDRQDLDLVSETLGEDGYQARLAGNGVTYSLVVTRGACGDGMSDRSYGWTGTLYRDSAAGAETLQGCCTLDGRQAP